MKRGRKMEAYKVAINRGGTSMAVSAQWANRSEDERFLSLESLYIHCATRARQSGSRNMAISDLKVLPSGNDANELRVMSPHGATWPTNHSFGQLTSLSGAIPSNYLRNLPAPLAAECVNHALRTNDKTVKAYVETNGHKTLRALTGPKYGRIFDFEVVAEIQRLKGNWKVPGTIDWSTSKYDPQAPNDKQSTTLYASDRDMFAFLVDDTTPVEVGKLPNGEPDLMFRGFYAWNSEVGNKSLGLATFWLRAVCGNRCIWGMEDFAKIRIRHNNHAPARLFTEFRPMLQTFAQSTAKNAVEYVKNAQRSALEIVAPKAREAYIQGAAAATINQRFTRGEIRAILAKAIETEQRSIENVWDFVNGATAIARDIPNADRRVDLEKRAGELVTLANK